MHAARRTTLRNTPRTLRNATINLSRAYADNASSSSSAPPPPPAQDRRASAQLFADAAHEDAELAAQAVTAAGTLAKLVDLRNANARGVAYENRRRIVQAFAGEGRSYNPGLPECQGRSLSRFEDRIRR